MKSFFLIFFSTINLISSSIFCQSSGHAEFELTFNFAKKIPVKNIKVYYYFNQANDLRKINYKVDVEKNQLKLFVENHFIYGVNFPTLIFSHKKEGENPKINFLYYFMTENKEFYDKDRKYVFKINDRHPNTLVKFDYNKSGKKIYKIEHVYNLNNGTSRHIFSNVLVEVDKL